MNKLTPFPGRKSLQVISFNRKELAIILSIYGKMVAAVGGGDFGISALNNLAVF